MSSDLINQLLTPLIFAVFALGFGAIWYSFRNFASAGWFALSYGFGALAFTFEAVLDESESHVFLPWFGDMFYVATAAIFCVAVYRRYDETVPVNLITLISLALLLGITWFRFLHHDVEMRVQIISYGCGALLLLSVFGVAGEKLRAMDRLLYWLIFLFGAQFFLTTYLILQIDGQTLDVSNFTSSLFLAITNFIVSALSLSIAVALFVKYGMDIISTLHLRSNTDDLTHLLNRRGFEEKAEQLLGESSDLSMILTDIDHFKAINDCHGHQAGDQALKAFADLLSDSIRQSDLLGRVGGEEFAMLLPGASLVGAADLAERIRKEIVSGSSAKNRFVTPITASFGVAAGESGDDYQSLFQRADKALYCAKNAGRNRVETV